MVFPDRTAAARMQTISHTVALLVVAIVVAILARRVRLPYTVGLVVTGAGLALVRADVGIGLTHEFIYAVALPPLLFEAALFIPWPELRRDAVPILTLAVLGTVVSAVAVTAGMVWGLHWPVPAAVTFGVLIAATDPVAVIALFKDTGIEGRLRLLVESESLLNDGVAAVLFALVLVWLGGDAVTPAGIALALAKTAGGGVLIGLLCGGVAILVAGRTTDRMVETAVTVAAAYGSFMAAEQLHMSGVLATVAAGLLMGNVGALKPVMAGAGPPPTAFSKSLSQVVGGGPAPAMTVLNDPHLERTFVLEFWTFAAFIANSLVFVLIGVTVARIPFAAFGGVALAATILIVLIGRALTVYPFCAAFRWSRWAIPFAEQHILWWGGLRGALGLALALTVPEATPLHDQIVIATFGVVAFSVIAQGVTMQPLLRRLGLR